MTTVRLSSLVFVAITVAAGFPIGRTPFGATPSAAVQRSPDTPQAVDSRRRARFTHDNVVDSEVRSSHPYPHTTSTHDA